MIASLSGAVATVGAGWAVIEVGGVGYLVHVPAGVLASLRGDEAVRLITHLVVREDSMTLYGFSSPDQRELFQTLMNVTGIGPKLALAILSAFQPEALRRVVAAGDADALVAVSGIGKRGAQRILLELRERLPEPEGTGAEGAALAEVREALLALGYAPAESRAALDRLAGLEAPVEELVRLALRELARPRAAAQERAAT